MKNKTNINTPSFKFSTEVAKNLVQMFEQLINESIEGSIDNNPELTSVRGLMYNHIDQNVLDTIDIYLNHQKNDIRSYFCIMINQEFPVADDDL